MVKLRDLMTPDPVSLSAEMSLRDALELLRSKGVSGAPVMAGNQVVGVLSASDLLDFATTQPTTPSENGAPEEEPSPDYWDDVNEWAPVEDESEDPSKFFRDLWPDSEFSVDERWSHPEDDGLDALEDHSVSEIMTRSLCFLGPDDSLQDCAAYMVRRSIHRVLVMEDSRLLGIVSTLDIVRAVADGACGTR